MEAEEVEERPAAFDALEAERYEPEEPEPEEAAEEDREPILDGIGSDDERCIADPPAIADAEEEEFTEVADEEEPVLKEPDTEARGLRFSRCASRATASGSIASN
jgi:hypothetical protein